jgi:AraC family transcriptional regulator
MLPPTLSTSRHESGPDGLWQKVEAHIDAHLFEPLSVASSADVAGLSPYHFSRAFTARFGESAMSFVRTRRMAQAAERLNGANPPSLADLAFDCGFESQEAFTRAFRRSFGVPPGQFKRQSSELRLEKEKIMSAIAQVKLDLVQRKELVRREGFVVAGAASRFDTDSRNMIPALWPKLISALPFAGQRARNTYGVCWGADQSDGSFQYMAGVEVEVDTALPDGFSRKSVPAQTYLVFHQTLDGGELHPQVQAAVRAIWPELLPKSGYKLANAPDLEVYPENFNPTQKGMKLDYYVPVVA